ncbi:hypothetical protein LJB42_003687 [Komagataella kurtzmanii]|nr:hypothetical protein LJB42_003687 [Komagataella kurtzmanii]
MKESPHKIDFKNGIFDNCLQKLIKDGIGQENMNMQEVWVMEINPKDSSKVNGMLRELKNFHLLPFLKKFQKRTVESETGNSTVLDVLIGETSKLQSEEEVNALLKVDGKLRRVNVPSNYPPTKELCTEWSKIWPIVWKGNPIVQELNSIRLDIQEISENLSKISELSVSPPLKDELPIFTMVADRKGKVLTIKQDERKNHQLHHSTMLAIRDVAKLQQNDPKSYLLLDCVIYTTHEPCPMCCMALLHSRIERLVYLKDMTTGGLKFHEGYGYGIQTACTLNWKFDAYRWCGDEIPVGIVDDLAYA